MSSSGSDSESEWNREMFIAVNKKQGKGRKISEQDRWTQILDCIEQGANINALDRNGNTVLDVAVIKDYKEVVKLLRQRGAQTAGAVKLADDLGNLGIASVSSNPNTHGSKDLSCQPTIANLQSAANDKPSTSGISTLPSGRDPATIQVPQLPKHKLFNDDEPNVVPKKRRLTLTNISDHEGQRRDAVCDGGTSTRSESSDAGHDPEENEVKIDEKKYWDPEEKYTASGLKQTFHGVVYQWKHLMLVLNRAWKKGYTFRLSTEMDAAEKFDDLVLEYVDNAGNKTHRFVQLKHKKDNAKTISARDLLDVKDGEFSVLKYFVSWRKIKKCSSFDGSQTKTFTLCTNIGLDVGGLSEANIGVSVVGEPDDFLEIPNRREQPPRYKLQTSKGSELYETLKFASDVHRLARELAERVRRSQDIHLNTDIMKRYHAALKQEVVDVKTQKFTTNFISNRNLSPRTENFREIFFSHTRKLFQRNASDQDIWNDLGGIKLKISANFGNKFELSINPKLTHVQQFSDEFVKLVNNAWQNGVVKIDRRIYNKRASELSVERIFADNIDKLAGHVLVTENKKIKFSSRFLTDVTQLLGNMEEFRDVLKIRLGSQFDELDKFEFEINNFKTCAEEELFSTTELPGDDISDGEILDFLDVFVLAVDQPDEKELGDMIEREIGDSRFDLPDAKFFTDSLQIEILDWFKETGKQSVFLANKNARDIFVEIEGRLSSLVTMDLRSEYPAKLEKWGIRFRSGNTELWEFVQTLLFPPGQILVISSGQTLLTALRVYQTLESLRESEPRHGFIFVRLERLFETKILDEVLRTFEWRDNHNLLVVNCESICLMRFTRELWNPVCRILAKNTGKKMILIVQDNQDVTMEFRMGYKPVSEEADDLSIVNLKKFSQQKLLERKVVKFQGRDESFGRLLGIRNSDNIAAEKLERLRQIIEPGVLVQLIKSEEIQIGSEVDGLGPIQNYYIPRRIVRHVVIKADKIEAHRITDLFAVSGINEERLRIIMGSGERIRSFDENVKAESSLSEWIVLSTGEEPNQFETLCQRNLNRNIHWLQGTTEKLIWIRSFGAITSLLKYKDDSVVADDFECGEAAAFPNEDELVEQDLKNRVVIISDTAGMGKSTVLTSLAEKMKYKAFGKMTDDEPPLLMIRINLTRHTNALNEERAKRTFDSDDVNGALDFLVDKLSSIDTSNDLTSRVYKTMIKDGAKAVLFLDGFDEVSPTYEQIAIDLLQALVKLPMTKLFVTSRPHLSKELEEKLATFTHKLRPFSPNDQRNFLKKFWKTGISENDWTEALEVRLEMHAEAVMKLLARSISDQMTEFTGVPLQTRMVAEIYQYIETPEKESCDVIEAIENSEDSQQKLPEKIDMIDLYQKFIERKYNVFFTEKQPGDPTNLAARQSRLDGHYISTMKHQKFALDALFNEEAVCALISSQPGVQDLIKRCWENDGGVERTGIVALDVEGKPHFVHRTFAEYYAATFLIETLAVDSRNQELREFFLAELFVESQYRTIRAFVNCLLSRKAYAVGSNSWSFDLCEHCNSRDYNTVYYVAAQERNFETVKFFLNRLEANLEEQETGISIADHTGSTPLTISVEKLCDLDTVKCFISRGANVNWKNFRGITVLHTVLDGPGNLDLVKYLCDKGADINCQDQRYETPLHYAVRRRKNSSVVEYLCEKGANIDCKEMGGNTPLHYANRHAGNLKVVKCLCENGADVNLPNHSTKTPLHLAAHFADNLDVVKYLCSKGADVNSKRHDGRTPLHYAANDARKLDLVKYLCDQGACVDSQDRNNETPLHVAARRTGNLDIVKYLCEQGANLSLKGKDDQSPLHCAAYNVENSAVVKYLCEKGAPINSEDEKRETPLHYAVRHAGNLDLVKYLCENGADINFRQRFEETPLYFAADTARQLDIVKYLCEQGADINLPNKWGKTPLHCAARHAKDIDVVKYLCEKGASIDCQGEFGELPLHTAASYGRSLAVKYLCDRGAKVNWQDEYGRTPLHEAAGGLSYFDGVKYLCESGADINCQDKLGASPLHWAARSRKNLNVVKYLCEKGASIDCQNERGETPLHLAANHTENFDVVKYLCESGANVNCQDKLGKIPLHEAASKTNNLEAVKYLCAKGSDINCQVTWGWTPLHFAADSDENFETLKYLCDAGADVNRTGNEGEAALHRATLHGGGNLDMVKYLCDKGADVNLQCRSRRTPLHVALDEAIGLDVVRCLIDRGANVNAQTEFGFTPLHIAAQTWHWRIIQFLLERGADASIRNRDGDTPLSLAVHRCTEPEMLRQVFGNGDDVEAMVRRLSARIDHGLRMSIFN